MTDKTTEHTPVATLKILKSIVFELNWSRTDGMQYSSHATGDLCRGCRAFYGDPHKKECVFVAAESVDLSTLERELASAPKLKAENERLRKVINEVGSRLFSMSIGKTSKEMAWIIKWANEQLQAALQECEESDA